METQPFGSVLRALRFDRDGAADLRAIEEKQWPRLLALTDEARLTLPLGIRLNGALPETVRVRIEADLARNAIRHQRAVETCRELRDAFDRAGIPFVFLKGLTHFPHFCRDPRHRQQYDIDVFSPPENLDALFRAATDLGYRALDRGRESRADHLPVMIRATGWRWRGDYYDPEMPLHLELHFRLWDSEMEQFALSGEDRMWQRRERRQASGLELPALRIEDTFRYAARHIVRHLLRGSLCPGHLYEFAHFLENTARDDGFWSLWNADASAARPEALAADLAAHGFGCSLHPAIGESIARLPAAVRKWFDLFALSPLAAADRANKDELWLHLLLAAGPGKFAVARRRLLPAFPSRFVRNPYAGEPGSFTDHLQLLARRAAHHFRTLGSLARSGARWIRAIG